MKKKKTPEQIQTQLQAKHAAKYESDLKKFAERGAAVNDEGKYLLYILYEDDPGGAMAYFFDKYYKSVRISAPTFYRLLDEGKAVRVNPDDL